jgi:hypothetical protein
LSKTLSSPDLDALLKQIDYKPSTISNRLAPRDVRIDPDSTIVTFDGSVVQGSKKDIMNTLAKFEKTDELAKMIGIRHSNNGDMFKVADNYFRVDVPSMGVTKYFTNAGEATEFLNSDLKSMKNLKDAAGRKGLTFAYDSSTGGYVLGDGKTVTQAKNADEVIKVLKAYPDAPGSREILSAIDPQADEMVKQIIDNLPPDLTREWKATGFNRTQNLYDASILDEAPQEGSRGLNKPGVDGALREWFNTNHEYIDTTIRTELGLHDFADKLKGASSAAEARLHQYDHDAHVNEAAFRDSKGKIIPVERREAILAYREAQGVPESLPLVKEKFGDLTQDEQSSLARAGELMNQGGKRFRVDFETWRKGYMMHTKKYIAGHTQEVNMAGSAEDILDQAYGNHDNIPKALLAKFRYERAETLINASMETDPLKIMNNYFDMGNKEMLLKPAFEDVLSYLKKNGKNIPADVINHTMYDLEMMANRHSMAGMQGAMDLLDGVHQSAEKIPLLGKLLDSSPGGGSRIFQGYMTTLYGAKIAFKPYSAVRNILNLYQLLGPRIGLANTVEALQQVVGPARQEIMARCRNEGYLLRDVPMSADMGQGKLQAVVKKGMSMMYNSDDIARAVPAIAAENMLDRGIASWNAKKFGGDVDEFIKATHLDQLHRDDASAIATLALSGDQLKISQARNKFAKELSTQTNPEFNRFAQPHVFTNTFIGNLFGSMGSYSTALRENLARGWRAQEGLIGKTAFVGKYIGISLAIQQSVQALGINGKDFSPGSGLLFGGGPAFSDVVNAAQALGPYKNSSDARMALEKEYLPKVYDERTGTWRDNPPTSYPLVLQNIGKAYDYASQGEYWNAFLAGSSAPVLK